MLTCTLPALRQGRRGCGDATVGQTSQTCDVVLKRSCGPGQPGDRAGRTGSQARGRPADQGSGAVVALGQRWRAWPVSIVSGQPGTDQDAARTPPRDAPARNPAQNLPVSATASDRLWTGPGTRGRCSEVHPARRICCTKSPRLPVQQVRAAGERLAYASHGGMCLLDRREALS